MLYSVWLSEKTSRSLFSGDLFADVLSMMLCTLSFFFLLCVLCILFGVVQISIPESVRFFSCYVAAWLHLARPALRCGRTMQSIFIFLSLVGSSFSYNILQALELILFSVSHHTPNRAWLQWTYYLQPWRYTRTSYRLSVLCCCPAVLYLYIVLLCLLFGLFVQTYLACVQN